MITLERCLKTVLFRTQNGTVHYGYWPVMWSRSAVCGPLTHNVGRLDDNVGLKPRLLSANLVPILLCLWSQALLFVVHYSYVMESDTLPEPVRGLEAWR